MELVKEILKMINILTVAYLIYYIVTALFILKTKQRITKSRHNHKFAILVPARNEEYVIGNLLKSLKNQEYPKESYDIFVIINNCTDKTKEIALENNVNVLECEENIKSKGEALRFAFNILECKDYEAFIIFDSDNIVHPKFISKMNDALDEGYQIAQGFRDSKNPSDTWISSCYSIHYLIHNTFLNKSRMNIGKNTLINGTGFMISKKILDRRGYDSKTLTEDIELTVKSAINGENIAFVEEAITYDEQVTTFDASWKQRKRWSIGTIQCFKLYFKKLLKKGVRKKDFSCIDSFVFLISPFMQFIGAISYVLHFIILISQDTYINYTNKLLSLLIWYLISIVLAIVSIKLSKKHIKPYIKGIITMPIFVLSWMPINVLAIFDQRKRNKWEKIEHTRNITIDTLLEANLK